MPANFSALTDDCTCRKDLLREAAEWRLLGLLFASPNEAWREQIAALAAEANVDDLREAVNAALAEADIGLYHSTFGPGGPAAPREVSYQPAALSGQYLAELSGYYRAFDYDPPQGEPPDHIRVELDFLAYLKLKQAFAEACLGHEQQAVTIEAIQEFLQNHLSLIVRSLADTIKTSGIQYLQLAAAALLARTEVLQTCSPKMPTQPAIGSPLGVAECPLQDCCSFLDD